MTRPRFVPLAVIAAFLLAVVFTGYAGALGRREQDRAAGQTVQASGRVRLVGSSPMTTLVITGDSREWIVAPDERQKLEHLQQHYVTVRATEHYLDRFFANGSFAERQYYLENITIINTRR